jgi:hypothetical protein
VATMDLTSAQTADSVRPTKPAKARRRDKPGTAAMTPMLRRLTGTVNALEGLIAFVWLVASYGLAERLVAAQEAAPTGTVATRDLRWWGLDIPLTLNMSLLIVGAAAGAVGAVVQQGLAFAQYARYDRLKNGQVWWYVLFPVWAALLGAVVVVAVNTGLISIGDETTSTAGVTVLVTMGALAGLFTNQALRRLRPILGGPTSPEPTDPQPPTEG